MNEQSRRYAIGIDVGTENVRAVVMEVRDNAPLNVIGYGELKNSGMRKGVVANLAGPAKAVDDVLAGIEKMTDVLVNSAYVSVNGSHLVSIKTEGMITVASGREITGEDLKRLEESAMSGRVPQNREIVSVVPLNYILDGQGGIRDPIGMNGVRLEMRANVVSGLAPSCNSLVKAISSADTEALKIVPTAVAAGRAVLTEQQMEDGAAVIDFGAATTSVAVYDEGDLQYVGVVGAGSNNITKDLAVGLETDMELAEIVKLKYVTAYFEEGDKDIMVKNGRENVMFSRDQVNQIVEERLVDVFEYVNKLLRSAGYAQRLPGGIVMVGGGSRMQGIAQFAKGILKSPVKVGKPGAQLTGVVDAIEKPEYATAVGLALLMADDGGTGNPAEEKTKKKEKKGGLFGRFFH